MLPIVLSESPGAAEVKSALAPYQQVSGLFSATAGKLLRTNTEAAKKVLELVFITVRFCVSFVPADLNRFARENATGSSEKNTPTFWSANAVAPKHS